MKTNLKNQKGFSLLEAMLGMLIVVVGFMGVMPIMSTATAEATTTNHYVAATALANEKLENIIADKSFTGFDSIATQTYPSEALAGVNSEYTRSVIVTEVNTTDLSTPQVGTGYKKVDVTVTWGQQSDESVTVTTLLTDI